MNRHPAHTRTLVLCLILALIFLFSYSAYRLITDRSPAEPQNQTPDITSKTVVRGGVEYFPRQDITTLLLLGIDEYGPVEKSQSYVNEGESDLVSLVVFDETNRSFRVLMLNRDTILEMPVLGLDGKPAGTATQQLALAHTYGSGLSDSCENTKSAVSSFLNDITIDYYLSLNMDAISILTDSLGGVDVTVTEDFSAIDPTIPLGEVTLSGEQALHFVQGRKSVGDELNLSRIERQKAYINGFVAKLSEKLKHSDTYVIDTFGAISNYTVSDLSATTLSSMLSHYADYTYEGLSSPEGESRRSETYMEFYADEEKLEELIFSLFYSEKKL